MDKEYEQNVMQNYYNSDMLDLRWCQVFQDFRLLRDCFQWGQQGVSEVIDFAAIFRRVFGCGFRFCKAVLQILDLCGRIDARPKVFP